MAGYKIRWFYMRRRDVLERTDESLDRLTLVGVLQHRVKH